MTTNSVHNDVPVIQCNVALPKMTLWLPVGSSLHPGEMYGLFGRREGLLRTGYFVPRRQGPGVWPDGRVDASQVPSASVPST